MSAVNDTMKKTTVHSEDVLNINGRNVYVDNDGKVIRTEKRKDKRKLFANASDKIKSKQAENSKQGLTPQQLQQLEEQYGY